MANKKNSSAKQVAKAVKKNPNLVIAILSVLVVVLIAALIFSLFYGGALGGLFDTPEPGDSVLGNSPALRLPVELSGTGMMEIHFIDVGQGDGILIRLPDGIDVLIDSGSGTSVNKTVIQEHIAYLHALDLGNIEYMIATHPDSDHINMLDDVLDNFTVENIYYNAYEHNSATFRTFQEKASTEKVTAEKNATVILFDEDGDLYRLGNDLYTFDIYAPGYDRFEDVNSMSPIIHLSYAGFDILFTGDAHTDTETWFLETYDAIDCDVLKVGHHGSPSSTGDAFLDAVRPEFAVISVGEVNTYHHPYPLVMNRLYNRGIVTYRTNRQGTIVLLVDDKGEFAFDVENKVPVDNNKNGVNDRMIVPAA